MFSYDPKDASKVWPVKDEAGQFIDYDAMLKSVTNGTSKTSGQPMQTLEVEVYNGEGKSQTIKEYVTRNSLFKLKQLAAALGKAEDFKQGQFQADDHIGAGFIVSLSIEEDLSGAFEDKNKVGRFKPALNATEAALNAPPPPRREPQSAGAPFGDEKKFDPADIPF